MCSTHPAGRVQFARRLLRCFRSVTSSQVGREWEGQHKLGDIHQAKWYRNSETVRGIETGEDIVSSLSLFS